jgi:hypothetical protein
MYSFGHLSISHPKSCNFSSIFLLHKKFFVVKKKGRGGGRVTTSPKGVPGKMAQLLFLL